MYFDYSEIYYTGKQFYKEYPYIGLEAQLIDYDTAKILIDDITLFID